MLLLAAYHHLLISWFQWTERFAERCSSGSPSNIITKHFVAFLTEPEKGKTHVHSVRNARWPSKERNLVVRDQLMVYFCLHVATQRPRLRLECSSRPRTNRWLSADRELDVTTLTPKGWDSTLRHLRWHIQNKKHGKYLFYLYHSLTIDWP